MTEFTFAGTVTVDGIAHQVASDGTITQVSTPPAGGGGGGTGGGGGGGGGGTGGGGGGGTGGGGTGGGGGSGGANQCVFGYWDTSTDSGDYAGGLGKFSATTPKSVTIYLYWQGGYPTDIANFAKSNNLTLYLNLEPWNTGGQQGNNPKMTDIAKGTYDSYLTAIGNAIKAGGADVWVTFAHEMNGSWYPWGIQAVSPANWQAAWKHVVTVIRAAAGGHAKMVWCPNNADVGPVAPYYPGDSFLDIAGFDGYLNDNAPDLTYASFVKQTVDQIRATGTSKPIWNAETGVAPLGNRAQRYTQFIADMKADGLIGFTQFNEGSFQLTTQEVAAVCAAVNKWNQG